MRPKTVSLGATGFSPWIMLNWRATDVGFAVALGVKISSGATLTWSVQHTFDDIWTPKPTWIASRVTTTVTVTQTAHGLTAADWVKFEGAAPFNTEYAIAAITDDNIFTVTVANSGATSANSTNTLMKNARIFNHDDLASKSTSEDGNYAFPPRACRLLCSAWTNGAVDLTVIQAGG